MISALLVFFGIRSYRENLPGGRLTFGRRFAVGILITLVSNFCVAAREVAYFKFMPGFADKYAAAMVERAKASGEREEKIERATRQAQQFKEMYRNPVVNVALTFAEVFPIGLAVKLVSAAILRKKQAAQTP